MLMLVLALLSGAFMLSTLLTLVVRSLGRRLLLLDSAGVIGQHKLRRTVPNIGGVAVFWTIALPIAAGLLAAHFAAESITAFDPELAQHLPGIRDQTQLALCILITLLTLHILGLVDDRRPLGPLLKFAVMIAAAAAPVLLFDARLLTLLDALPAGRALSAALTILWLVAVTNAMNFMDNMDGLCAGVGAVAGAFCLAAAILSGQWFVAMFLAILVGALLGFLVFNAPRPGGAGIFLGDGGSLIVGFLLAFLTVRTTYIAPPAAPAASLAPPSLDTPGVYAFFMPLCFLAIPLYDMTSVILIRLAQGRSPMVGDRQHFSHRLLAAGLSVPRALAVLSGCTAITGVSGLMLAFASGWQALLIAAQVALVLLVIALYEHGKGWPFDAAPERAP
ncbi:MAG: MraY family glycosyltransferase [Planctomycetota bacterium]|nr:MraY family glycosyltransferase [Planctomycetota bacterium]